VATIKEVKAKKGVSTVTKGTPIGRFGQALRANSKRLPLEPSAIAAMDMGERWP
jgi:hypothetical protein